MEAVRINPAKLDEMHVSLVYEAIQHYRHIVKQACDASEGTKPAGLTICIKAVEAWATGFEVYEYLCERQGYDTVPQCAPDDWYDHGNVLIPLDPPWTEYQRRALWLRYGSGPDPEDTALD